MAISVDGYIAKKDDDTSWISTVEWNSYAAIIKKSRCLIVGHRTYDILTKQPEFAELGKIKIIIVSNKDFKTLDQNHQIAKSCKEAVGLLTDFEEVIVAGGGILNSSFMKERLVDEIYLDVEPIVLGEGIQLFKNADFEVKLELLETSKLSADEIQLHYKVHS